MNRICSMVAVLSLCTLTASGAVHAQQESTRYALLIGGLGGSREYDEKFSLYLYETRKALLEKFHFPENEIIVLAGSRSEKDDFINGIASAENIRAQFSYLSKKISGEDDFFIFLFGHGSFDGTNSMLNIPRQDLKDSDYAELLQAINARKIVVINTASCSAPFISHLSAPERILITSTKSGTERNETIFPKFLIEAMNTDIADQDRNGDLTILEVFQYASGRIRQWYRESNHLETEHPILEDTGDKLGYGAEELSDHSEGGLAGTTYLLERFRTMTAAEDTTDSVLSKLFAEQKNISQEISIVRSEKSRYSEQEYFAKLEPLFIRLAKTSDEIEKHEIGR